MRVPAVAVLVVVPALVVVSVTVVVVVVRVRARSVTRDHRAVGLGGTAALEERLGPDHQLSVSGGSRALPPRTLRVARLPFLSGTAPACRVVTD